MELHTVGTMDTIVDISLILIAQFILVQNHKLLSQFLKKRINQLMYYVHIGATINVFLVLEIIMLKMENA